MDSALKVPLTLGGRQYTLSALPFKKNRIVVPSVSFALRALERAKNPGEPLNVTAVDHIYIAVFEAVNHADPEVTREKFDEWGLTIHELSIALTAVALATGCLVKGQVPVKGDGPPGEAEAGK